MPHQLLRHLPLVEVSEHHQPHQHLALRHLLLRLLEVAVVALELHQHLVDLEQQLIQVRLERHQLLLLVVACLARQHLLPVVGSSEALLTLVVSELRAPGALVEVDSVLLHPHPLVEIQEEPLELRQRRPLAVFSAVQHLQLRRRLEPLAHLVRQPLRLVEVCLEHLHQRQEACLVRPPQHPVKVEDPRWFHFPSQLVKTETRLPIFPSNPLLRCNHTRINHLKN